MTTTDQRFLQAMHIAWDEPVVDEPKRGRRIPMTIDDDGVHMSTEDAARLLNAEGEFTIAKCVLTERMRDLERQVGQREVVIVAGLLAVFACSLLGWAFLGGWQ